MGQKSWIWEHPIGNVYCLNLSFRVRVAELDMNSEFTAEPMEGAKTERWAKSD